MSKPDTKLKPKYRGVWVSPYTGEDGSHHRRIRAEFDSSTDAHWWWYGIPEHVRSSFRIENMDGEEVVVRGRRERDGRLSHTSVILASIDRAEREKRKRQIEASGFAKGDSVRPLREPRLRDPNWKWETKITGPGVILGFLEDPTQRPVCVYWVDDQNNRYRAWFEFDDIEHAEGEQADKG